MQKPVFFILQIYFFYRFSRLPLTEKTRDLGIEVAKHVRPQNEDSDSYAFPVSTFMTEILRKSDEQEEHRKLQETNKEWAEKMVVALAKNMPREHLMDAVISRQYRYFPFYNIFEDNIHAIDMAALIRRAYPPQTFEQMSKVFEEKAEKNPTKQSQIRAKERTIKSILF